MRQYRRDSRLRGNDGREVREGRWGAASAVLIRYKNPVYPVYPCLNPSPPGREGRLLNDAGQLGVYNGPALTRYIPNP